VFFAFLGLNCAVIAKIFQGT